MWPAHSFQNSAEVTLGSLVFGVVPRATTIFPLHPARSLHAAVLRRLEQLDPQLSAAMHDARSGAHSVERPWTLGWLGPTPASRPAELVAPSGVVCWARVSGLTGPVLTALRIALRSPALLNVPLELEHVEFDLCPPQVPRELQIWEKETTYSLLAGGAQQSDRIGLRWFSPVTFRRSHGESTRPDARLCFASYVRRWNRFADPSLHIDEDHFLQFVVNGLQPLAVRLLPVSARLAGVVHGHIGEIVWRANKASVAQLRQLNALADYALFCGTGAKTALGLGQTQRFGAGS